VKQRIGIPFTPTTHTQPYSRMAQLLGDRFKRTPKDAAIVKKKGGEK